MGREESVTSPPAYQASSGFSSGASSPSKGAGGSSRIPPPMPPREVTATALYDFVAQRPDDLPFKKGDQILITKRTDSTNDWWVGRCNGKTGNFPANYVRV